MKIIRRYKNRPIDILVAVFEVVIVLMVVKNIIEPSGMILDARTSNLVVLVTSFWVGYKSWFIIRDDYQGGKDERFR